MRSFLGLVNYYRDMWKRRSHVLAPLTELTKVPKGSKKFNWTEKQDKAFDEIKKNISEQTMLAFPDFEKPFDIHTDASDYQLGAVVSQEGKPIAFYSRKLNAAQCNYTTGEREMLSIVETLKEFRTILLGRTIIVYTDHKNLIRPTTQHASPRIQRWRWVVEEFGPEFRYIEGPRNVVADCLSRLDANHSSYLNEELIYAENFNNEADDNIPIAEDFPVSTQTIAAYQRKDKLLMQHLQRHPEYFSKTINGEQLVLFHKRIYIPKPLRRPIIRWSHTMLNHPGIQRTERTIRQHLTWPGLSTEVENYVQSCHECQRCKAPRKKYGHLPEKEFSDNPWDTVCVDLIGPYSITTKDGKELSLLALTMCDPATGWFEIAEIGNKKAETAASKLDESWLCRYPRPSRCIFDNGNEFLGKEFQELLDSYGIKPTPTTVKNPQANHVERVHQTLGNMLRTKELEEHDFNYDDPWSSLLASCAWAIRSTVHTVLGATPAQVVFGRDMLFDLSFKVDWDEIKGKRQKAISISNERENRKRTEHVYIVNDKVLLDRGVLQRKLLPKRDGPYDVVRVYSNGTLKIRKGFVTQRVSVRRCVPYRVPA